MYLLPSNQNQNINESSVTLFFSVLVESTTPAPLNLINANGNAITPAPVLVSAPPLNGVYESNSVATYSVTYPGGQSTNESLAAVSSQCTGTNCSNTAYVNFTQTGAGILTIAPSNVNVSPSYTSQTYTLTNTGESNISVSLPSVSAPFSIVSTCGNNPFTLTPLPAAGSSCTYTLTYTPGSTYGNASFPISYTNGLGTDESSYFSVAYTISPNIQISSAVLNPIESAGDGSSGNPFAVQPGTLDESLTLTYVNNGYIDATNFKVESGNLLSMGYTIESNTCNGVLLESNESTSCYVVLAVDTSESGVQNLSLLSNSLATSWTYLFGSVSNESTPWYNNSESQLAVYLSIAPPVTVTAVLSSSSSGSPVITSESANQNFYIVFTLSSGGYNGQTATYGVTLPSGMNTVSSPNCSLTVGGTTQCSIEVNTGSSGSGIFGITPTLISGNLLPLPATPQVIINGNFAYVIDGNATSVWVYVQDPTTGALTSAFNESAPTPPSGSWVPVTLNVIGNLLYVGDNNATNGSNMWVYTIDPGNGSLTYFESVPAPTPVSGGANPDQMAVNGSNTYQANNNNSFLFQYLINPDGSLTYQESAAAPSDSSWGPIGVGSSSSNVFITDSNPTPKGVWQYVIESDGSLLSSNVFAPVPNTSWDPNTILVTNNQYAYVADDYPNGGGLWEYQISPTSGTLSLSQNESVALPTGVANWAIAGANTLNNYAYILDTGKGGNDTLWTYNYNESTGQITTYANNSLTVNPLGQSWEPNAIAFYTPLISISQRGLFNGYVIPGNSFVVSENLNYGNNYGTQTIQATITPADSAITMTPANGQCTLSNGSPNCNITVNAASNAVIESHVITFTNITGGGAAAQINISPNIIPFSIPRTVFTTRMDFYGNLNQYCTDPSCATDPESGIHGADALCQESATLAQLPGTYKALLISSTRYPCDASGNCGGSAASDWVLKANEPYMNVKGGFFANSNSNAVFPGNLGTVKMYYADGTSDGGYSQVFTGINSVLLTPNDAIGWAYSNINNESGYADLTCNDWRSNSNSPSGQGYLEIGSSNYPGTSGWMSGVSFGNGNYNTPWMYDSSYSEDDYKCNSEGTTALFCVLQ